VVAKVHLGKDARKVPLDPLQRGLPYAVLPRGDDHQVARRRQALQTVQGSCRHARWSAPRALWALQALEQSTDAPGMGSIPSAK